MTASKMHRGARRGVPTGSVEKSPRWRQRRRVALAAEEQDWAAKAGPVTVTRLAGPDQPPVADSPVSAA
jgi:hypothetical protein